MLILIRHGQAQHNVDDSLWSLNNDDALGLTSLGVHQAVSAGKKVLEIVGGDTRYMRLVTSPQIRAVQTASILRTTIYKETSDDLGPAVKENLLKEFYVMNDGIPLVGFDFDEFMKSPNTVYSSECGLHRTRSTKELLLAADHFLQSLRTDRITVAVSHHFTISAILMWKDLTAVMDRRDLIDSASDPSQDEFWERIATSVVNRPVPNAEPLTK